MPVFVKNRQFGHQSLGQFRSSELLQVGLTGSLGGGFYHGQGQYGNEGSVISNCTMPPQAPLPDPGDDLTFEQELAEVERSLQDLKARYTQVQQDQQQQAQLQQQRDQIRQALEQGGRSDLKAELKQVQEQIDALEVNLESRLFQWSSLKEPFWQIIRFGGLGVVIGWLLAFVILQQPKPEPQPSSSLPPSAQA